MASEAELRVILTYVETQIAAAELLLNDAPEEDTERYWRYWLTQYQWWRDKVTDALDGRAEAKQLEDAAAQRSAGVEGGGDG